jgi:formylglycine-generating enzyme required for sulfatase activity
MWASALVQITNSPACIYMDATEVTVAAYTAWATANPTFAAWDPACTAWKPPGPSNPAASPGDTCTASVPSSQADPFDPQKPIRCVDWCDAQGFCNAARGGRLCYRAAVGGSLQPENKADEWPSACSNSGTTAWPWGDDPDAGECNVGQPPQGCGTNGFSCGPVEVAMFGTCVDRAKVFDLIGNVSEWMGICSAQGITTGASSCETAGGSYADPLDSIHCNDLLGVEYPKSSRRAEVGFRCCYDLNLIEKQDAGLL